MFVIIYHLTSTLELHYCPLCAQSITWQRSTYEIALTFPLFYGLNILRFFLYIIWIRNWSTVPLAFDMFMIIFLLFSASFLFTIHLLGFEENKLVDWVRNWRLVTQEPEEASFEETFETFTREDDSTRDSQFSVTLLDPDVLDCPVCCEPLKIPIFQVWSFFIFQKLWFTIPYCFLDLLNSLPYCFLSY